MHRAGKSLLRSFTKDLPGGVLETGVACAMSEDFSDFFDENDWDDVPEPIWKEFDWQRYLNESDGEIEKFVQVYALTKPGPDRLDQVAKIMGWDSGDWSIEDSSFASGNHPGIPEEELRGSPDYDPFTIHQHPVFIATRGIFLIIKREWESLLRRGLAPADPQISWMLGRAIHEGELAAILATQAVEMGDVELAVCHFKAVHGELNRILAILPEPEPGSSRRVRSADQVMRGALFDLREIALRVIYECRDEARRRPSDHE